MTYEEIRKRHHEILNRQSILNFESEKLSFELSELQRNCSHQNRIEEELRFICLDCGYSRMNITC